MSRFNLYVDGFNLYHALKAAASLDEYYRHCYWLDLVYLGKWFEQLHPDWKLEKVKFFTAPDRKRPPRALARRPGEPKPKEPKTNQFIYWDALRARGVEIIEGYFRDEILTCMRESCLERSPEPWDREYADTTEKKTDVALGSQMVCDALTDSIEGLVLITRDADQIPALDLIARRRPSLFRCVAFPPRQGEHPRRVPHEPDPGRAFAGRLG